MKATDTMRNFRSGTGGAPARDRIPSSCVLAFRTVTRRRISLRSARRESEATDRVGRRGAPDTMRPAFRSTVLECFGRRLGRRGRLQDRVKVCQLTADAAADLVAELKHGRVVDRVDDAVAPLRASDHAGAVEDAEVFGDVLLRRAERLL